MKEDEENENGMLSIPFFKEGELYKVRKRDIIPGVYSPGLALLSAEKKDDTSTAFGARFVYVKEGEILICINTKNSITHKFLDQRRSIILMTSKLEFVTFGDNSNIGNNPKEYFENVSN